MKAVPAHQVREAVSDAEVARCFPVLKVLRPQLGGAEALVAHARKQSAAVAWRLFYVEAHGAPVGCATCRIAEHLAWGRVVYVDDLVVIESERGKFYADALLNRIEEVGRAEACVAFHLDSGTQRLAAHRFYHRWGLSVASFHFTKPLR